MSISTTLARSARPGFHAFVLSALLPLHSTIAAQTPKGIEFRPPQTLKEISTAVQQCAIGNDFNDWTHVWMYYSAASTKTGKDIFSASRSAKSTKFTGAAPVAKLNTVADELMPHVCRAGRELYFVRQSGTTSQIMVATWNATLKVWNQPIRVSTQINATGTYNTFPALSQDGLTLFFTRRKTGKNPGPDRIFVAKRMALSKAWSLPVNFETTATLALSTAAPVPRNNGHRHFFRVTDKSGKLHWGESHIDPTTGKWTTPTHVAELAGVSQVSFHHTSGEIFEVHANALGQGRVHRRRPYIATTVLNDWIEAKTTKISMPTLQRYAFVPQYEVFIGDPFQATCISAAKPNSIAYWALSPSLLATPQTLAGLNNPLLVDLALGIHFRSATLPHVDGMRSTLVLQVPRDIKLIGLMVHMQSATFDPNGGMSGVATIKVVAAGK